MSSRYKRLAIISDCLHTLNEDGSIATENHVYCRQMQALAVHFEETLIVCPFVAKKKSSVVTTYTVSTIRFLQLPNAGGNSFGAKIRLIKIIPVWWKAFAKAFSTSDVFYLRMPNNLNIPGFFYFYFRHAPVFSTYTGTWKNYKGEPATYRFQKWLLKRFFRGPVWIYDNKTETNPRLLKSISPSFSEKEWTAESEQVEMRKERLRNSKPGKKVFISVGSLVPNKNHEYILRVCKYLKENNFRFYWYIVGDGYMKKEYENFVNENDLREYVCLTGRKTYEELQTFYRKSDFIVQATLSEGFGKAPIEAMCHGVIPLLSKTAMAEEMTGNGIRGYIFDNTKINSLIELIKDILKQNEQLIGLIENGRRYVRSQTLEKWAMEIVNNLNNHSGMQRS